VLVDETKEVSGLQHQQLKSWLREIQTKIADNPKENLPTSKKIPKLPESFLSEYDIKIYRTEQVRAAVKLYTDKGNLSLKKTHMKPERLAFITAAASFLHQRGFHKVMEYLPTKSGRYFFGDKKGRYVLTKWVKGKESDMKNSRQEFQAAVTMAQLHQSSPGFKSPVELSLVSRQGLLLQDLANHLHEFDLFSVWARENSQEKLANLVLKHNSFFKMWAKTAVVQLEEFNYRRFLQESNHTLALLHQDFVYHNLLWTNGEIHLIDLDYLTFDLRVIDLAKFLRRNLRMSHWKMKTAHNIIKGYTSVLPLGKEEIRLLYILLCFPYKYWQYLHIYLIEGKKRKTKRLYENLKKLAAQQKKKENFLARFSKKYLEQRVAP